MSWFDDFDWKSALKTIAPTVASIFGTPLAGAGVSALLEAIFPTEDVRGMTPAEQEQKLQAALQSGLSPEQIAAMKKADYDFQQRIAELGLEELKVNAADRDSARNREIQVKDKVPAVLATVAVVGFFGILGTLFFVTPPADNGDVIYLMIGGVIGAYTMVLSYYFGSSSGSKFKTRELSSVVTEATRAVENAARQR